MKAKIQKIKKTVQKNPKKQYGENEVKRYLGALSENFQNSISAIVEQFVGFKKTLDSHTEMIGNLMVDVAEMKGDIVEMKGDIVEMKGDIVEMKGDIKVINGRLDRIEQNIKEMRDEIKELKSVLKSKAEIERVELLETRLYRVEERLKLPA